MAVPICRRTRWRHLLHTVGGSSITCSIELNRPGPPPREEAAAHAPRRRAWCSRTPRSRAWCSCTPRSRAWRSRAWRSRAPRSSAPRSSAWRSSAWRSRAWCSRAWRPVTVPPPGRVGRRARWRLTQSGRELLAEGAARIYAFGRDRESWDGRWLVLTVTVPETRRELRHQLRTRLTWAGFGSPAPGVWVSPHPAREGDAKGVVEQLGLDAAAFSFSGPYAGVGSERTLVEQAWHLGDLAAGYEDFLQEFAGLRPGPGDPTLLAQVRLVHEWRKFPMRDPELPRELLPPDWVGVRAANVFADLHTSWNTQAQRHWAALCAPPQTIETNSS